MKIKIDIDCSPEEARTFLGLPDVAPMQAAIMKDMEERVRQAMGAMDPDTLMRTWMPMGAQGLEQAQKLFWNQFGGGGKGKEKG
jgi:Family of unknown function (DUF6489)